MLKSRMLKFEIGNGEIQNSAASIQSFGLNACPSMSSDRKLVIEVVSLA